jgi:hypothetical protein
LITTHTLVSQDIYAKVAPLEGDWFYLSEIRSDGLLSIDRDNQYFKFDDGRGRQIIGDAGLVQVFNQGILVKTYGEKKEIVYEEKTRIKRYQYSIVRQIDGGGFAIFSKNNTVDIYCGDVDIPVDYDPAIFDYLDALPVDCDLVYESPKPPKIITRLDDNLPYPKGYQLKNVMSDYELYNYYMEFDFDQDHPARYALAHNELIKRGLIDADPVKLDDYNMEFGGYNV